MLENAQNIMYLSAALGVLLLAGMITWLIFYFVMIVRDLRTIITKTKETLATIHELISGLKKKIDETSVHFKFLLEGMKTLLDWIKNKQNKKEDQKQLTTKK